MSRIKDLSGMRFGRLTVKRQAGLDNNSRALWLCKCDCGNEVVVKSTNLIKGSTQSCGCIRIRNISGQKFGRLTAQYISGRQRRKDGKTKIIWHCICDCGNEVDLAAERLVNGNTKSCGCYNRDPESKKATTKHGLSNTRLFTIWQGMKQRCYYKKHVSYDHYGGRGIQLCEAWKDDFKAFYDWAMMNGYKDNLTIDRIDVNGNYCPENCRWIPAEQQYFNRTDNRLLTMGNVTKTITEWSLQYSIDRETVSSRLKLGWSVERALTKPVHNT